MAYTRKYLIRNGLRVNICIQGSYLDSRGQRRENPGGGRGFLDLSLNYTRLEGVLCHSYLFHNEGVRWFWGLTRDFAGVFEVFFFSHID